MNIKENQTYKDYVEVTSSSITLESQQTILTFRRIELSLILDVATYTVWLFGSELQMIIIKELELKEIPRSKH